MQLDLQFFKKMQKKFINIWTCLILNNLNYSVNDYAIN